MKTIYRGASAPFSTSAALMLAALLCVSARAEVLTGRVVGLADGDSITVLDASFTQHRVRVAGIDAPERRQPFSQRSKAALSALVAGKQVQVDWDKKDRYQRLVGVVRVGEVDAGLELLKAGLAWHYKAYEREQSLKDRRLYAAAEGQARDSRKGLWSEPNPQAPWDYRKQRRSQGDQTVQPVSSSGRQSSNGR